MLFRSCVVMAAGGYPGSYEKGSVITGIQEAETADTKVFHAGTALNEGDVVASGGRVLGVTSLGATVDEARDRAYAACAKIGWDNSFYRKDIGARAIARLAVKPRVGVIMGSASDLPVMEGALKVLKDFEIPYEVTIASAHRTPSRAETFAATARERGISVIIAGAGHAAHLAGAMAAHTTLPVLGVPIDSSALQGLDALLSTVQMPPGVPVATLAVGKPGAVNAGVLAAQILGVSDPEIALKLEEYKRKMAVKVDRSADELIL